MEYYMLYWLPLVINRYLLDFVLYQYSVQAILNSFPIGKIYRRLFSDRIAQGFVSESFPIGKILEQSYRRQARQDPDRRDRIPIGNYIRVYFEWRDTGPNIKKINQGIKNQYIKKLGLVSQVTVNTYLDSGAPRPPGNSKASQDIHVSVYGIIIDYMQDRARNSQ